MPVVPDQARTQGVRAGPYLSVVRAHGSPADSPAEIALQADPVRVEADGVLEHALGVTVHPGASASTAAPPLQIVSVGGGNVGRRGGCLVLHPGGPGAFIELVLPPGGAVVSPQGGSPVAYSLRHFAASAQPLGTVTRTSTIRLGRARTALTWYLRLQASQPVEACAAVGGHA